MKIGSTITRTITAILTLLIGISMGDVVVSTVSGIATVNWTFTGHAMVATVINLIPLMYYAGVVVAAGMAFLYVKWVQVTPTSLAVKWVAVVRAAKGYLVAFGAAIKQWDGVLSWLSI